VNIATSADLRSRAGWVHVGFGDVAHQVKTSVDPETSGLTRYVAGEHMDSDDLRLRRWGTVGDGYLGPAFHRRFEPGQVLYGSRRTYLRKVAVAAFAGICANTTFVCEAADDRLLPEFLPFVMQTEAFHAHSIGQSKGSVNPYVNWRDIASYGFSLPPVEEQRRIAEALRTATDLVSAYQRAHNAAETARASCLEDILSSELAATRRVAMRDVCTMQNGRPFPSSDYCDEGVRLLRPGNLAPTGYLEWSEAATKFLPTRYAAEARDFLVDAGGVLINLTAQSLEDGFMGRVCLARESDDCLLNQRIGRFRCDDELLPEFLFRVLQSRSFRRTAESRCGGSKIRHLYWSHIEDYELPLPTVEQQKGIVGRLRAVDDSCGELHHHVGATADLAAALRENWLGAP